MSDGSVIGGCFYAQLGVKEKGRPTSRPYYTLLPVQRRDADVGDGHVYPAKRAG